MNHEVDPEGSTRTPENGIQELQTAYNSWSTSLAKYSVEASYAIIIANWAVHARDVVNNTCAILSIITCIAFLAVNIFLVWVISEQHCKQLNKALESRTWWISEHSKRKYTRWPYTQGIESAAFILRIVKTFAPILAGILFMCSV